jgi:phage terminase large subunit GpA-like protein
VLSSQNHYFFKCPCCSRFTELTFPECLVITAEELIDPRVEDSHLICKECKGFAARIRGNRSSFRGSQWVESYADRDIKGWHINQLYSPTVTPVEIAKKYLKAQQDKSEEQEFWNSKMGVPHEVDGARLSDQDLKECEGTT